MELTGFSMEDQLTRNASRFNIKWTKQITLLQFHNEVARKAKAANQKVMGTVPMFDLSKLMDDHYNIKKSKTANKLIFYFEINYMGKEWSIRRTYEQFKSLDAHFNGHLIRFKEKFKDLIIRYKGRKKKVQPPTLPPYSINDRYMIQKLNDYLRKLKFCLSDNSSISLFRNFIEAANFLDDFDGKVFKGGVCQKRIGATYKQNSIIRFCKNMTCCWKRRWFLITDEGVGYLNNFNDVILGDILYFDNTLRIRHGKEESGSRFGIVFYTTSRRLKFKLSNSIQTYDWLEAIADSVRRSPYIQINRFQSFSPIRSKNFCKWYINGWEYYQDMFEDLKKAKTQIFITDWWLSPELYLKRPVEKNEDSRLDRVLKGCAERGVRVFILVYKEFEHALPNASAYAASTLMGLHENIECIRHPDNLIFLWSHHEKSVIIDQEIGYMGGLDLCYGRYDLEDYPLSEPFPEEGTYFPGQDYSNVRIKDFKDVHKFDMCLVDKDTTPRMPWRDIAIKFKGDIVKDLSRHFTQYWNFAKSDVQSKKKGNLLTKKQDGSYSGVSLVDLAALEQSQQKEKPISPPSLGNSVVCKEANQIDSDDDEIERQISKQAISVIQVKQDIPKKNVFKSAIQKQILKQRISAQEEMGNQVDSSYNKKDSPLFFNIPEVEQNQNQNKSDVHPQFQTNETEEDFKPNRNKSNLHPQFMNDEELQQRSSNLDDSNVSNIGMLSEEKDMSQSMVYNDGNDESMIEPTLNPQPSNYSQITQNNSSGLFDVYKSTDSGSENKNSILLQQLGKAVRSKTNLRKLDILIDKVLFQRQQQQYYLDDNKLGSAIVKYQNKILPNKNSKNPKELSTQEIDSKKKDKQDKAFLKNEINEDALNKIYALKKMTTLNNQNFGKKKISKRDMSQYTCNAQLCRSSNNWSLGLHEEQVENSIQMAYLELIKNAQNFIYIENQFFVSSVAGDPVSNQIASMIAQRIIEAIECKQKFMVCVVVPLLPGFEGDVEDKSGNLLRIQLGWEYNTMCRGGNSIIDQISKKTSKPWNYIRFFGVRNHGVMKNGDPKTEIVYIHSKLMIVDDRYALIGSANINDRSQTGSRDSELAVIVEDDNKVEMKLAGKGYQGAKFAHDLRMKCFMQLFGFTSELEITDPCDSFMWEKISKRTAMNTEIYRKLFGVYPDDEMKNIKMVKVVREQADISLYDDLAPQIQGFGVDFPLKFLAEENLKKIKHFEFGLYVLPEHIFT